MLKTNLSWPWRVSWFSPEGQPFRTRAFLPALSEHLALNHSGPGYPPAPNTSCQKVQTRRSVHTTRSKKTSTWKCIQAPKWFWWFLTITNWGYDAFNKVCAGIKWENQEEDEKKVPNFKISMVDSIGDLILIFGLNLSIGSPYYQGGRIRINFKLLKCFIWDDIFERKHSQNTPQHKLSALCRMIRPWSGWSGQTVPGSSA